MTPRVVDPSDTLAVLEAAEGWLSDKSHWIQGNFWRDASHRPTDVCEKVRYTCGEGALSYVAGAYPSRPPLKAYGALTAALDMRVVTVVNDKSDGYERIMAGLRKAIATLKAK